MVNHSKCTKRINLNSTISIFLLLQTFSNHLKPRKERYLIIYDAKRTSIAHSKSISSSPYKNKLLQTIFKNVPCHEKRSKANKLELVLCPDGIKATVATSFPPDFIIPGGEVRRSGSQVTRSGDSHTFSRKAVV